jgi:hypothetical protein
VQNAKCKVQLCNIIGQSILTGLSSDLEQPALA